MRDVTFQYGSMNRNGEGEGGGGVVSSKANVARKSLDEYEFIRSRGWFVFILW